MTTVNNCKLLSKTPFLQHCKNPTVKTPLKGGIYYSGGFYSLCAANSFYSGSNNPKTA